MNTSSTESAESEFWSEISLSDDESRASDNAPLASTAFAISTTSRSSPDVSTKLTESASVVSMNEEFDANVFVPISAGRWGWR